MSVIYCISVSFNCILLSFVSTAACPTCWTLFVLILILIVAAAAVLYFYKFRYFQGAKYTCTAYT